MQKSLHKSRERIKMRLLLIDDHVLFMEGLKNMLEASGFDVVGTVDDSRLAVVRTDELKPDVILMDIQMPHLDGIEATKAIKGRFPEIKIVMLTVAQDDAHLFEALKAGASGYLLKGMAKEKFFELLAGIANGEAPLSPGLASRIIDEFAKREREKEAVKNADREFSAILTARQINVLKLVAQGLTYKEAADRLGITEAAVKYHMGEIISRLNLENRAQAVAFANETGLAKAD